MEWLIIGSVIAFLVVGFYWKTDTHPLHVLERQAARMNWVADGAVRDTDGYRNIPVARNGMSAITGFNTATVILLNSPHLKPFADFIELEKWLARSQAVVSKTETNADNNEIEYHERVVGHLKLTGECENVLALQGTDNDFFRESMMLYKCGYQSGISEGLISTFVSDAANQVQRDRDFGLDFLRALQEQVKRKTETP